MSSSPIKPHAQTTVGGPSLGIARPLRPHVFSSLTGPNHPNTPNPPGVGGTPMVNPTLPPVSPGATLQVVTTPYIPFGWTARTPGMPSDMSTTLMNVPHPSRQAGGLQ